MSSVAKLNALLPLGWVCLPSHKITSTGQVFHKLKGNKNR